MFFCHNFLKEGRRWTFYSETVPIWRLPYCLLLPGHGRGGAPIINLWLPLPQPPAPPVCCHTRQSSLPFHCNLFLYRFPVKFCSKTCRFAFHCSIAAGVTAVVGNLTTLRWIPALTSVAPPGLELMLAEDNWTIVTKTQGKL